LDGFLKPGSTCTLAQIKFSIQAKLGDSSEEVNAMTSWKEDGMTKIADKPIAKLRKAPQPPLVYPGATPDSDRAKKPALSEAAATGPEVSPGDHVEGLGNFGKPSGEFGTVKQANEEDAVVKWDDDGRTRLGQRSLRKA
jgi:hypothetical protein